MTMQRAGCVLTITNALIWRWAVLSLETEAGSFIQLYFCPQLKWGITQRFRCYILVPRELLRILSYVGV